jgi:hypothetical protein
MSTVVEFDDAEVAINDALIELLDIGVTTEVPNPRPTTEFITSFIVGGHDRTLITERVRMSIECWAPTRERASTLASDARVAVMRLRGTITTGGTCIYRVTVASRPVPLPDPLSGQPRFTFLAEFDLRGHDPETSGS